MGLANLAIELKMPNPLKGTMMLSIIDEMLVCVPIILESFYFNQQKRRFFFNGVWIASDQDRLRKQFEEIYKSKKLYKYN